MARKIFSIHKKKQSFSDIDSPRGFEELVEDIDKRLVSIDKRLTSIDKRLTTAESDLSKLLKNSNNQQ